MKYFMTNIQNQKLEIPYELYSMVLKAMNYTSSKYEKEQVFTNVRTQNIKPEILEHYGVNTNEAQNWVKSLSCED